MRHSALCILLLAAIVSAGDLPAPKIDVALGHAQTIALPNQRKLIVAGDFAEGKYLRLGGETAPRSPRSLAIPVENLLQAQGTILVKMRFPASLPPETGRYFLTLRTAGRLTAGFILWPSNRILQFGFGDRARQFHWRHAETIQPDRDYWLGFSYDGTSVRIYVDGKMAAEKPQPLEVDSKVRFLYLGTYADGYARPPVGAQDLDFERVMLWDTALTAAQVARLCGAKVAPLAESHPMTLAVPAVHGAAPVIDGENKEPAWDFAASMPRLIAGNFPKNSPRIPPHDFKLAYDDKNLYCSFTTLFPGKAVINAGAARTPAKEPEVWGTESFEFYLLVNGTRYRFGANVAGGTTERRGEDSAWNGPWNYQATLNMRIDDSKLWTGEFAIPWTSLGLSAPPSQPIPFNFCRSWKLAEFGGYTSLNHAGGGYGENWPVLRLVPNAPVLQVLAQNNPGDGEYRHEIAVASAKGGPVRYTLALARVDGTVAPMELFNRTFTLKPGERHTEKLVNTIASPTYDCLLYTLHDGKGVAMREFVPFEFSKEYFTLQKLFLHGELRLKLKDAMLRAKYGASFVPEARLLGPDGKPVLKAACKGAVVSLPFPKDSPVGMYTLLLVHPATGESLGRREFNFPGIGAWATREFPNRIIPPFLPLAARSAANSLEASLWNRRYQWNASLFASSILSAEKELLAAPVTLEADGSPLAPAATVTLGATAPHRAEFTATASAPRATVVNRGWLEYDGVNWNQVTVQTKAPIKNLRLKVAIPAKLAKYIHACTGNWNNQISDRISPRTLPFFPVVWLGMEDKGLCFFAESRATWKSGAQRSYTILPGPDETTFFVELADALPANATFTFDFGLIATPVRPLPRNYPLDAVGTSYTAPLNRPGRAPVNNIVYLSDSCNVGGTTDLGSFFCDQDTPEGHVYKRRNQAAATVSARHGGRPMPYTSARYISSRYPEMEAFKDEWQMLPETAMDYSNTGHFVYECCPATGASAFFAQHADQGLIKGIPEIRGIYFDFGVVTPCSNELHGCHGGYPLLAMREFYRRIAIIQLEAGIKEPVVSCHNTDNMMLPIFTFATHLQNGERIRQASSTILHNKKDILDTYGIPILASELSTLPFGVNNSIYLPCDLLLPKYGGDEEEEPYKFRMTKAGLAGSLIHNTIPFVWRLHYGIFDKLFRAYEDFGVPQAQFIGYWDAPAAVQGARDIYVSAYRHPKGGKALLVVGHVGKPHLDQTFQIKPDLKRLGLAKISRATDLMTAPDPDYQWLFEQRQKHRIPVSRCPLALGDFGSKVVATSPDAVTLKLDHHCFSLVLIEE